MQKKQLLAKLLYDTRLVEALAFLGGENLTVLNYHRIRPDDADFATPFDEGVYGPTQSQFLAQMRWLKKHRRVLSEDELIDCLKTKQPALRHCVLVTFDDGYLDNYTLAYPVLKALGMPAIFFIPTHLIDSRQLGWWDIIAYLIKHCAKPVIDFAGKTLPVRQHPDRAVWFATQKMKLEKAETTQSLLDELAAACDVALPPALLQDCQLMTWHQIREVAQGNIAIGSHTHTHRVLATLDPPEQLEELVLSKAILERQIGKRVRSVAYPVGGSRHFTDQTQTAARTAGYDLGFSYRVGPSAIGEHTRFAINRTTGPCHPSLVPAVSILPQLYVDREDDTRYQMEFEAR